MKKILGSLLMVAGTVHCDGQFLGGFFSQKKADLKALEKQLAAIMVYVKQTEAGYATARAALTSIGQLKKGELDLHTTYFSSLRMVSPVVAQDPKIHGIFQYQAEIVNEFHQLLAQASNSRDITLDEVHYLHTIYQQMLTACDESLDQLKTVTTDDQCSLSDAARIQSIDQIYETMKIRFAFTRSISDDLGWIKTQRGTEKNDIESAQKWR